MAEFRLLMKFLSQREYVDQMRAGRLHMKRLKYFRECEEVRADKYEGTILREGGELYIQGEGEKEQHRIDYIGPLRFNDARHDSLNLFCMTCFRAACEAGPTWETFQELNERIEESRATFSQFGNYAVLILDTDEFLRRVGDAVEREGYQMASGLVKYYKTGEYPQTLPEPFGERATFEPAFFKRRSYELEREYRIAVNTSTYDDEPRTLDIGDASDITAVFDIKELGDGSRWVITHPCPLCGRDARYDGVIPPQQPLPRGSEFNELQQFRCDNCGRYSITGSAGEVLNQMDPAGVIALGLEPRSIPKLERRVVDATLVEGAGPATR